MELEVRIEVMNDRKLDIFDVLKKLSQDYLLNMIEGKTTAYP